MGRFILILSKVLFVILLLPMSLHSLFTLKFAEGTEFLSICAVISLAICIHEICGFLAWRKNRKAAKAIKNATLTIEVK